MRAWPSFGDAFLTACEADRLSAYQDGGGVWTIGRGHTGNVQPGQTITEEQSLGLLHLDEGKFCSLVYDQVADDEAVAVLTDHEYVALVSFAFNLGTLGSTIPAMVRRRDVIDVPNVMLQYDHEHIGGVLVEVLGLKHRREAEVKLFETADVAGAIAHAQSAPVQPPSSEIRQKVIGPMVESAPQPATVVKTTEPPPAEEPAPSQTALSLLMSALSTPDGRKLVSDAVFDVTHGVSGVAALEPLVGEAFSVAKPLLASRTIWGVIIAGVATALGLVGHQVPAVQQQVWIGDILTAVQIGGLIVAGYGRIVAKGPLT